MTIALDIIKGALRRINSYQSGEPIDAPDEQDCLETLNDLLDSWSTDELHVFGSNENILSWVPGKNQYSIGAPTNAFLGQPAIVGTLTSGSPIITGVTAIPSNLVTGAAITDLQNLLPAGATVLTIGASTITLTANATNNSTGTDQFTYTIPGDFNIPRPLRITHGFTRFNSLDFTLDVCATESQYTQILYKAQPGPWPTIAWYNNTMPYGTLKVYQTPGNGAELHLFTDTILSNVTLTQAIVMPQGYARALKWNLARELCAEFGFPLSESIKVNAQQSLDVIKALNAKPAGISRYERALVRGSRPDGGWITHGGYRG